MRVLIGCEESGVVRRAFRALGHDAWSLDIQPARDGSSYHFEWNLADFLTHDGGGAWDLAIFHPPCTRLTVAGARWQTDHWVHRNGCDGKHSEPGSRHDVMNSNGCRWHDGIKNRAAQKQAVEFFRMCLDAKIPRVAVENPVGVISSLIRPPDQYIQPWQFGHGEQKKTGLWLRNLPLLKPTKIVSGREQRVWKMAPGPTRERDRSETYTGIAEAMAQQWGALT